MHLRTLSRNDKRHREREREKRRETGQRAWGGGGRKRENDSGPTCWVQAVFDFVRFAEFEIVFVLFFLMAFLTFKDLMARPEYNQILVKKPGGPDWWPK